MAFNVHRCRSRHESHVRLLESSMMREGLQGHRGSWEFEAGPAASKNISDWQAVRTEAHQGPWGPGRVLSWVHRSTPAANVVGFCLLACCGSSVDFAVHGERLHLGRRWSGWQRPGAGALMPCSSLHMVRSLFEFAQPSSHSLHYSKEW